MLKTRKETVLAVVVLAIGFIPTALVALWGYMGVTATRLHPDAAAAPAVSLSAPVARWADAAEEGRQIARAGLAGQNLPGLSVAVGVDGDVVWAEGFGYGNLESRVPVAPDTSFRIGTASNVLTSAAVGRLLEDGRLKLDDAIQTYVPAFPRKQWPVTLRQLMGHVAGLGTDGGDEGPLFSVHCARPADALPYFAERPLLFEPGTDYRYSSYGWIVVSAAVEAAAGQPFLAFMQKQVFEPLGMHETRADSATRPSANSATPYFPRFASDPRYGLHLMRPLDYSCYAGASVFQSTPSDLVRFAMAINGGRLLQPATVDLLQTSQRLASGKETGYGLGWDLETAELTAGPTRWTGHVGELLGGTVASLMTLPEHGIVVAVVSNISYADTPALASKIAGAFADAAVASRTRPRSDISNPGAPRKVAQHEADLTRRSNARTGC